MKTIFLSRPDDKYLVIPNVTARDKSLSLKARGLLFLALSNSEAWVVTKKWISQHCPEGRDAVASAMRELEEAGYIVMAEDRDAKGRLQARVWTFHDVPVPPEQRTSATKKRSGRVVVFAPDEPKESNADFPYVDKPYVENPGVKKEQQEEGTRDKKDNLLGRELLEAVAKETGYNIQEMTDQHWSDLRIHLKVIASCTPGVSPNEVFRRANHFRLTYPDARLTPRALAKHWPAMDQPPKLTGEAKRSHLAAIKARIINNPANPSGARFTEWHTADDKASLKSDIAEYQRLDPSVPVESIRRA